MAYPIQDGNFASATQNGAAQIDFPLQNTGDYYARTITRECVALASAKAPNSTNQLQTLTTYANLLSYSEDFTNAAWTSTAVMPTTGALANPADGLVTMNKILETVANSEHSENRAITFAAVPNVLSVILQAGLGRDYVRLKANDGTTSFTAFFNLTTGTVGTVANCTTEMVSLGDGAYRCSIFFTPAAAVGNIYYNSSTDGSTVSYVGDVTKGFYAWGAELKRSSVSGPYVPTTTVSRSISSPAVDSVDATSLGALNPGDPFAYLVEEEAPNSSDLAKGFARWDRMYSRIPAVSTVQTTLAITKPTLPNQSTGTPSIQVQTVGSDTTVNTATGAYYNNYLFDSVNHNIYGPLKSASVAGPTAVASGLFTLNYRGTATGNLNYNDNIATIQAALNGLATVIADGLTFAGGNAGFTVNGQLLLILSVGSTAFKVFINNAFTPTNASTVFTTIQSPTSQLISTAIIATISAHGFDTAKTLITAPSTVASANSNCYVINSRASLTSFGSWVVIDANTIGIAWVFGLGQSLFANFNRSYTPGPDRVGCKLVTNYYLPGVTAGIATAADIPVPAPLINDSDFIAAAIANTSGYLNYDSDPLVPWNWPIFQQVQKQINMADV